MTTKYDLRKIDGAQKGWDAIIQDAFDKLEDGYLVSRAIFTAGEAISKFDAVYFNAGDGKVYKALNDGVQQPFLGIAIEDIVISTVGRIQLFGEVNNPAWTFTAGDILILDDTTEGNIITVGNFKDASITVGRALSATLIYITSAFSSSSIAASSHWGIDSGTNNILQVLEIGHASTADINVSPGGFGGRVDYKISGDIDGDDSGVTIETLATITWENFNAIDDSLFKFYSYQSGVAEEGLQLGPNEAVFNDTGLNRSFRVESDTQQFAFYVQGSNGFVSIGDLTPVSLSAQLTLSNVLTANGDCELELRNDATQWSIKVDGSDGDTFKIDHAGGDIFEIDINGNVGIGITPTHLFHVHSTSATDIQITDDTSGGGINDGFLIRQTGVTTLMSNRENGDFTLATNNGAPQIVLTNNSGKVSIGNELVPDARLTINQGSADDNIMSFKSSDVAHGMTTVEETDTFGKIIKNVAASGGLEIQGYSESTVGMWLQGNPTTPSNVTSTAADGAVVILGAKKSGTTLAALAATENVFVVANLGTARVIFKGNGDVEADGTFTSGSFDVAEYFEAEKVSKICEPIGLNLETGKVRPYQAGDILVGLKSLNPAFVGNKPFDEDRSKHELVGLVGQFENVENVYIENKTVYTEDKMHRIGYVLANNRVLLKM